MQPETPSQVVGSLRQTAKGWFMVPVGMLTTQQREYTALHKAAGTEVCRLDLALEVFNTAKKPRYRWAC